jgi:hypothetical protein
LVYGKDHGGVIGGVEHAFLLDVPYDGCSSFASKIPAAAFAMFEVISDYELIEEAQLNSIR